MIRSTLVLILVLFSIYGSYAQDVSQEIDTLKKVISNDSLKVDSLKIVKKVKLNWMNTYDEALEKSKEEKKPVLIYFTGSDWCPPCITLDRQLFYTDKFKELSDKELVLLEVDFPRNKDLLSQDKISENIYLKQKYKVNSFPTLLFVNHRGRKVAERTGYIMSEYYYPFIESVLNKK